MWSSPTVVEKSWSFGGGAEPARSRYPVKPCWSNERAAFYQRLFVIWMFMKLSRHRVEALSSSVPSRTSFALVSLVAPFAIRSQPAAKAGAVGNAVADADAVHLTVVVAKARF